MFVILLFVFLQVPAQNGNGFAYDDITSGLSAVPVEKSDSGYRWIDRIKNIPDYMKEFHKTYGEMVNEVLEGGQNCLSDPFLGEIVTYDSLNTYNLQIVCLTDTFSVSFSLLSSEEMNTAMDSIMNAMMNVHKAYHDEMTFFKDYLAISLDYDYPEAFWINPQKLYFNEGFESYQISQTISPMGDVSIILCTKYTLYMRLAVNDVPERIYDEFLEDVGGDSLSFRYNTVTMFNNSIDSIFSEYHFTSRYDELSFFNECLTKHNGYCSGSLTAFPTIRSSYSAIMGRSGETGPVCEGYARAFKVLCDRSGIPCILVVGDAQPDGESSPEHHMWNEVQMEDGLWYAVDVTWNDPVDDSKADEACSGLENDFWFLKGKNDSVAVNDFCFSDSHVISVGSESAYREFWDFSAESLIADISYDEEGNAVRDIYYKPDSFRVYSIDGRFIGIFGTWEGMTRAVKNEGVVLVNGKKVILIR